MLEYEDLRRFEYLSAPALSPDGQTALYVVSMAESDGSFTPRIYQIDLTSGTSNRFFINGMQDRPAWSPDGSRIAYLNRASASDEWQIWIQDCASGINRQLTMLRHGVSDFAWAPDGSRLAISASWRKEVNDGRQYREMSQAEKAEWDYTRKHEPIVIENLMYKFDDTYGITDQTISHVLIVDADSGEISCLTEDPISYYRASWSPDSRQLAFYGKPFQHTKENRPALFLFDLVSSSIRQLESSDLLYDSSPTLFTSDGKGLVFEAFVEKAEQSYLRELFLLDLAGNHVTPLFPETEICHGVEPLPVGRMAYGYVNPVWQISREGKYIYFLSGWDGRMHVFRLPLAADRNIEQVTFGNISVHSFCVPQGGRLLLTRSDLVTPAELYRMDEGANEQIRLTYSNRWLDSIELAVPMEMRVDSTDGLVKIHGFLVPPTHKQKDKLYPAVLNVHGGPEAFYPHDFWFESQMLAARGFAVICCDPRGSAGYGAAFGAGTYAWGQESIDDLLAFIDATCTLGFIDPEQIGVTGGSYGGHMTLRLIGSLDRFKAAVAQRSLCNLATSYGTGDMGFIWKETDMPTQMQNLISRVDKSPITRIDKMKTPLLILHATNDYRCSFEQAEQLFIAMKDRNPEIPVRMVAFPGENHNLTRSGRIYFQIAHLKEMTLWFERFLKEGGES